MHPHRAGIADATARYSVYAIFFGAFVLAVLVVLLPFTKLNDVVADVISMVILIGALTFARFLDRRSGVFVAVLAGIVAAVVPGHLAIPPHTLWELILRLVTCAIMATVYYWVIVILRGHAERAQRQLEDLRALHHEVREVHALTTGVADARQAIFAHVAVAAMRLGGGQRSRLRQRDPDTDLWGVVAQWPEDVLMRGSEHAIPILPTGTTDASVTYDETGGYRITVAITVERGETMALEVDCVNGREIDEHAQLLAVYARDVNLALEHITLQEQLSHLVLMEERGRIARELHDGLVQSLGGLAYRIEYYGDILSVENVPSLRRELTASAVAVRKALREARLMIHGLRDASRPADLRTRLLALLDEVAGDTGMEIAADLPPLIPTMAPPQVDTIYRVAQEALQNAVKHSEAESIAVALLVEPERVELTVTDDGCGFVYRADAPAPTPLCYGIVGMMERAAQQGGRVMIQTQPELGTSVTLTLPLVEVPA